MSHGKQFTLYTHAGGPNGWKVALALELLGLTYEPIYLDFSKGEHKGPEYTKLNPNGRIPTIIDHKNGDFTLWESGAILQYLVDKYDPEHKISVSTEADKFKQLQWLFFQASGQGPYFGQAAWFGHYHPEKIPSAIERYQNEIKRVWSVLESVLKNQDWLVGNKLTIADISFVPWNDGAKKGLAGIDEATFEKDYPSVAKWHTALVTEPTIKKVLDAKAAL
ncbi:glutathione S-transferase, partial [Calocera cornea HHB12733]